MCQTRPVDTETQRLDDLLCPVVMSILIKEFRQMAEDRRLDEWFWKRQYRACHSLRIAPPMTFGYRQPQRL